MNNSHRRHLDLKALRYVDAQAAGDVETMTALWDEACDDPALERLLCDIDEGLYHELAVSPQSSPSTLVRSNESAGQWVVAACVAGLIAATVLVSMPIVATRIAGTGRSNVPIVADKGPLKEPIASGRQATDPMSFSWPLHNTLSVGSSLDAIE